MNPGHAPRRPHFMGIVTLLAVLAVVMARMHPVANALDPSWIDAVYDDADADSLLSSVDDGHARVADPTVRVPELAAPDPAFVELNRSHAGRSSARPLHDTSVRGPPPSCPFYSWPSARGCPRRFDVHAARGPQASPAASSVVFAPCFADNPSRCPPHLRNSTPLDNTHSEESP